MWKNSWRALPITYTYVPRASLELTNETTFEGQPLTGRFDVCTPHEPQLFYMKQAFIYIELDERERVVNVRIVCFGCSDSTRKANPTIQ
jgi:hypothetical protein